MGGTNRRLEKAGSTPKLKDPRPGGEHLPARRERGLNTPGSALEIRTGFRAVGVAASELAAPIVAKHGGGILTRLKAQWAAIVGLDWAAVTWPTGLNRDGVLKLRAVSGVALELQHRAPLLIERINLFFGRPAITRLALVQGHLPTFTPSGARIPAPLTPGEARGLTERLSDITEPELRDALARLGKAVIGEQP
jgi:hypothetical protein